VRAVALRAARQGASRAGPQGRQLRAGCRLREEEHRVRRVKTGRRWIQRAYAVEVRVLV
jgi:hypothetical protein